jgi:hypothetical protein
MIRIWDDTVSIISTLIITHLRRLTATLIH